MLSYPSTQPASIGVGIPASETLKILFNEASGATSVYDTMSSVSAMALLGTNSGCFSTSGVITIHTGGNPTSGIGNNNTYIDRLFDQEDIASKNGAFISVSVVNFSAAPTAAGRFWHYGGKYATASGSNVDGGINMRINATVRTVSASCHGKFVDSSIAVEDINCSSTASITLSTDTAIITAWDYSSAVYVPDFGGYYQGAAVHCWVAGTKISVTNSSMQAPKKTSTATCTVGASVPCGFSLFGRPVSNPATDANRLTFPSGTNVFKYMSFSRFNYDVSGNLDKWAASITSSPESIYNADFNWRI